MGSGAESDALEFRLRCVAVPVEPVCSCSSGNHTWQFSSVIPAHFFRCLQLTVPSACCIHCSTLTFNSKQHLMCPEQLQLEFQWPSDYRVDKSSTQPK